MPMAASVRPASASAGTRDRSTGSTPCSTGSRIASPPSFIISPPAVNPGIRVQARGCRIWAERAGYAALTAYHAHHRMTSVRKGAALEASTASAASAAAGPTL